MTDRTEPNRLVIDTYNDGSETFEFMDIVRTNSDGTVSQFAVGTFQQTLNGQIVEFDLDRSELTEQFNCSEYAATDIAIIDFRYDGTEFFTISQREIVELLETYNNWSIDLYNRLLLEPTIRYGRFDFDLFLFGNAIFDLTDDSFTDLFNALNTYLNNRFN